MTATPSRTSSHLSGGPALLSCLGMVAGAMIDASQAGFVLLASLCASAGAVSFVDTIRLHWLCLPYMHLGMLLGAVLAPCCRAMSARGLAQAPVQLMVGLACVLWMLLASNLGSYLWLYAGWAPTEINTMVVMFAAMLVGMQIWSWMGRLPPLLATGLWHRSSPPLRP